jgi:hypothetical protein
MSNTAPRIEVIYEPPPRTHAWWLSAFGAVLFFTFTAWTVVRMLQKPWAVIPIAAVMLLALVAPRFVGARGPMRVDRVLVNHDARRIEVARGREVIHVPFTEVRTVTAGEVLVGEGVPIDVVTVERDGTTPMTFSVIDRGAARGVARALQTVLTPHGS